MPVIFEVVAHGEKYTTADGQEKSRLINIGKIITKANGKQSLKLDTIPMNWDGWAMLLEPRPKDDAPQRAPAKAAHQPQSLADMDSDIPF
jgi:hypothetical protein